MCLQDLGVPTLKSANRHFLASEKSIIMQYNINVHNFWWRCHHLSSGGLDECVYKIWGFQP